MHLYTMVSKIIFADTNNILSEIDEAQPFYTYIPIIKSSLTLGEFMNFEEIVVSSSERIYYRMIVEYEENEFKVKLLKSITGKIPHANNFGEIYNEKASAFKEPYITKD